MESYMLEAVKNNTFDLSVLEKTLDEIKYFNFDNLMQMQRDISGFKRFEFNFNDLEKVYEIDHKFTDSPLRYRAILPRDFIDFADRESYKRSSVYNKMLDMKEIASKINIFKSNFLVFIDGHLVTNCTIMAKEDNTYFYFPVKSKPENPNDLTQEYFEEMKAKNARIVILYVANNEYGEVTVNTTSLYDAGATIPLTAFTRYNVKSNRKPIAFLSVRSELYKNKLVNTEEKSDKIKITPHTSLGARASIKYLNFAYVTDVMDFNATTNPSGNVFEIPLRDTPIPVENILVFKKDTDKGYVLLNDKLGDGRPLFNLYYPNIYESNLPEGDYKFIILYKDVDSTKEAGYWNEIELYRKIAPEYLKEYRDDTVPGVLKNYKPVPIKYDIKHYQASEYFPDHFKYKCEIFKEYFKKNNYGLERYNENLAIEEDNFYIDLKGRDLSTKIRNDNHRELNTEHVTFDEPHYVFTLRRDFTRNPHQLRFFINGLIFVPKHVFTTMDTIIIYIPVAKLPKDAMLEIERFYDYIYNKELTFTAKNTPQEITLPDNYTKLLVNDIFLIDNQMKYVAENKYKIEVEKYGEWIDVGTDSFLPLNTFRISVKDDTLLNKKLKLGIVRSADFIEKKIETEVDKNDPLPIPHFGNNDIRNFRLFCNGKILPISKYIVTFSEVADGRPTVYPLMQRKLGDEFVSDITPYKSSQVHYIKVIPEDGVIDLSNFIERPFNLKWYDIFINGRKLTPKEVRIVTPTLIVLNVKTVKSRRHLTIIQKDRLTDHFRLNDLNSGPQLIVDDLQRRKKLVEKIIEDFTGEPYDSTIHKIVDEEEDIIRSEIEGLQESILIAKMYKDDISVNIKWINPDEQQITQEFVNKYKLVLDSQKRFLINPDDGKTTTELWAIIP